jgi:hypothetical protein
MLLGILWAGGAAAVGTRTPTATAAASAAIGLGIAFYLLWAVRDHRRGYRGFQGSRALYLATGLAPIWIIYLLRHLEPALPRTSYGLALLAYAPLAFLLAQLLRRIGPADSVGAYLSSYGSALVGSLLVSGDRTLLAPALLLDAALAGASAWRMREPLWITLAGSLPACSLLLWLADGGWSRHRRGWWLIGLSATYIALSRWQRRHWPRRFVIPIVVIAHALLPCGLAIATGDQVAALWAYAGAGLVAILPAIMLKQPLLLLLGIAVLSVPYGILIDRSFWIATLDRPLAIWPGVVLLLAAGVAIERAPWTPTRKQGDVRETCLRTVVQARTKDWALPFYIVGISGTLIAIGLAIDQGTSDRVALHLALAASACALLSLHFRRAPWMLASVSLGQLATLAAVWALADGLLGLPSRWQTRLAQAPWQAVAFLPITASTATAAIWLAGRERRAVHVDRRPSGWPQGLLWILALDIAAGQVAALFDAQTGMWCSLIHALLFMLLALSQRSELLAYSATALGLLALVEGLRWSALPAAEMPWPIALLAFSYGLLGYGLTHLRQQTNRATGHGRKRLMETSAALPRERGDGISPTHILERPLRIASWLISLGALASTLHWGYRIPTWLIRAMVGLPALAAADLVIVQTAVLVLAITGLLYLTAALVRTRAWLGYGAIGLLLCAWGLEWFLVWDLREIQWYAVPAGIYLLVVGFLEYRQGRRLLGRWIDHSALLLLLDSSLYQSLAEENGWTYALIMGAECLALIWWGSARRQRRFLYAGVVGIVTDVVGQLIEPLLSANRWLVFGGVGLFVLTVAILVERSLETVQRVSQEWRERLEEWE